MKKYTVKEIRDLDPCFDPLEIEGITEDSTATLLEILELPIEDEDKIWVASKLLTDKQNRLFAVWCTREALKLVENPDIRSIEACNVAERFANGNATKEELDFAYSAAYSTTRSAAYAAYSAAYAARSAESAAYAARSAYSAAYAARSAYSAARSAARSAYSAAYAAESAAESAAYSAAWSAQIKQIIKLLSEEL